MSDGFLSYSDGVHDDVNKIVWSALAWDPDRDVRDILVEYARVHFSPAVAEAAADGLLALETNWRGPLARQRRRRGDPPLLAGPRAASARSCRATGAGRCACCAPPTTPTSAAA